MGPIEAFQDGYRDGYRRGFRTGYQATSHEWRDRDDDDGYGYLILTAWGETILQRARQCGECSRCLRDRTLRNACYFGEAARLFSAVAARMLRTLVAGADWQHQET